MLLIFLNFNSEKKKTPWGYFGTNLRKSGGRLGKFFFQTSFLVCAPYVCSNSGQKFEKWTQKIPRINAVSMGEAKSNPNLGKEFKFWDIHKNICMNV